MVQKTLNFENLHQAVQYLADQISKLSERLDKAETEVLAARTVLSWMIKVDDAREGTTRAMLEDMLSQWKSVVFSRDEEVDEPVAFRERLENISQEIQKIIAENAAPRPALKVIDGDKREPPA
ncbi:hypothetical protein RGQ15_10280 [Paracoccus sp. MBLB3053]|uniref:Uncharacterized protein n=1 Tax=Paracoccus aurantius TaxID=3073814 RepID=A0ABU2HSD6_9RHOB|nr:hypothetical protein [Paracoccus sp. MBLB3053]MDS9467952.1 hypothetical protein [Paracoccus sp. MBLB3053]